MKDQIGIFFLRVSSGLFMLLGHGYSKLANYHTLKMSFSDPLGIGSHASTLLVIFAEFFCALAIILGIKTRYVAIPLTINMLVAGFIHHSADPWGKKEMALIYAVIFIALIFLGNGAFALENYILKSKK